MRSDPYIIQGGTYVCGETADHQGREVLYYDLSYDDYKIHLAAGDLPAPKVLSPQLAEVRKETNPVPMVRVKDKMLPALQFEPSQMTYMDGDDMEAIAGFNFAVRDHDLKVVESDVGHVKGIAIVPRSPARFSPDDDSVPVVADKYTQDSMKVTLDNAKMSVEGPVTFHAGVVSKGGTLVADEDITIVAGRSMSLESEAKTEEEVKRDLASQELEGTGPPEDPSAPPDPNAITSALQLNLYTRGDLKVSTYAGNGTRYRSLAFKGLIYTWGDTTIFAGQVGSNQRRGKFTMKGALVAYGGDPTSGQPGESRDDAGKREGRVSITAKDANLFWDPRFLPSLEDLDGGASPFMLDRSTTTYPTR
jgi:hypothetical protein